VKPAVSKVEFMLLKKPIFESKNRNSGVDGSHDDCDAGISPKMDELENIALILQSE
jgi:hypothetical protein